MAFDTRPALDHLRPEVTRSAQFGLPSDSISLRWRVIPECGGKEDTGIEVVPTQLLEHDEITETRPTNAGIRDSVKIDDAAEFNLLLVSCRQPACDPFQHFSI